MKEPQPQLNTPILATKIRQFAHVTERLAACAHDFKCNPGVKSRIYNLPRNGVFQVNSRYGLAGLWEVRQALLEEISVHDTEEQVDKITRAAQKRYGLVDD